jgi:hypothetical protein
VGNGTYFFAVLAPGGQGSNDNPNDGTDKNLSDTTLAPYSTDLNPAPSHNADGTTIPVRQAKLVISCKVKVLAWNSKE